VIQSISRVRGDVVEKDHVAAARRVLALLAIYQDIEDLVNIGAYVPGANLDFDLAVQARPKIIQFLQQDSATRSNVEQSRKQLFDLCTWIEQMDKIIKAQSAKTALKSAAPARQ
jgi:flagellum-specific ATP synthase